MQITLPDQVKLILEKFKNANFEIYIVGGAVRDLLMGRMVDDWDFTTNAIPEEILKIIPNAFYDNKYGTVGVESTTGKFPHEITTFRTEVGYTDQRHPDKIVWGKTLTADLTRRDFTINALALSDNLNIIDLFGGQEDLKNKIIRAVGNPKKRFSEDALRLMRAIRISAQLGFTIEEGTYQAIIQNASLINKIAKERVRDELLKIIASPYPYEGMLLLRNSFLMGEILPELEKTFGVEQKSPGRHHIYDVGTHSLLSLKYSRSQDPIVRLAILIHDIGKPKTFRKTEKGVITFYNHEVIGTRIAENIAERFRLSNKQREKLITLVRWHQFTVDERQTESAIRRFIKHVGKELIPDILDLRVADRLGGGARETSWRLEEFKKRLIDVQKQAFSIKDLKINGNDVMKELNIPTGPKVGKILNQLFNEVVEKKLENNREKLLDRISHINI